MSDEYDYAKLGKKMAGDINDLALATLKAELIQEHNDALALQSEKAAVDELIGTLLKTSSNQLSTGNLLVVLTNDHTSQRFLINTHHTKIDDRDYVDEVLKGFNLTPDCLLKIKKTIFSISYRRDDAAVLAELLPGVHGIHKNPVTGHSGTLMSIIMNLNDGQKWTREAIADWVETLDEVPYFDLTKDDIDYDRLEVVTLLDEFSRFSPGESVGAVLNSP